MNNPTGNGTFANTNFFATKDSSTAQPILALGNQNNANAKPPTNAFNSFMNPSAPTPSRKFIRDRP